MQVTLASTQANVTSLESARSRVRVDQCLFFFFATGAMAVSCWSAYVVAAVRLVRLELKVVI